MLDLEHQECQDGCGHKQRRSRTVGIVEEKKKEKDELNDDQVAKVEASPEAESGKRNANGLQAGC